MSEDNNKNSTSQDQTSEGSPPSESVGSTDFKSVQQIVSEEVTNRGIDKEIGWLKQGQSFFYLIMVGIVIVLFLGFITLLFTTYSIIIQGTNTSSNTQTELIKSIESLRGDINSLKFIFESSASTNERQR